MSINVSACRYDGKTVEQSTLSYDMAFHNTGNQPYNFIKWAYDLTIKAIAFANTYEEAQRHTKNANYLHKYVQMGA